MRVRRFQPGDDAAIARLNERLGAGGAADRVYPEGREQQRQGSIRERLFVADDDGEIRGAVWLREQPFRVRGEDVVYGWLKYPVAESLVDPRFNSIPGSLLMQCMREQPRLLALGLGGHGTPLARMLQALRWTGTTVPMLVRFVRPARCVRELEPLRRTRARRLAGMALAWTGLAWLGAHAVHRSRMRGVRARGYGRELCGALGPWADDLWLRVRDRYEFLASRDAATVESILPASADILRLRVTRDGSDVGWVYAVRHDFSTGSPDRTFGRLTVGLIADAVAAPEHAPGVMQSAFEHLVASGVDLVISQQLHSTWREAARGMGFLNAPSNFAFYASPKANQPPIEASRCYINRGDCDGPVWYAQR